MEGTAIKALLTIAGFDPSSGAGATADLQVFAAHGFFGTSALTALTVQSTVGVKSHYPILYNVLQETLATLVEDIEPAGIKVGMLGTAENVHAVAGFVRHLHGDRPGVPIVLDPVIASSSGRELLDTEGLRALQDELIPIVSWITPNVDELSLLSNMRITGTNLEDASRNLRARYPGISIAATGGHLDSADDFILLADGQRRWLRGDKIVSNATHGTGCAFASALLCGLVDGLDGFDAALRAKEFVAEAIQRAPRIGNGKGPMDLLWPLRAKANR